MTEIDKIMKQIWSVPLVSKMTGIDKKLKQIWTVPLVAIYPQTCGICGKVNSKSLCNKCEIELKKQQDMNIIDIGYELEDKYFNELIYVFKYEGKVRELILDYKFNEKSYLYLTFVNFLIKNEKIFEKIQNYDTIVPVPISEKRLKARGYNQSLLIAREIANQLNLELLNNCLIKTKNIVEQSKLNRDDRIQNVKGVYDIKNKQLIKNKKILLIDDIYTTGSTVNECSKILRQGSPTEIGVLVLAKD